jgi:hypothetical protein
MSTERLKVYQTGSSQDLTDERRLAASRPADRWAEVGPSGPPHRVLWCRVLEEAPANPPDERYYADEVRPAGLDGGGHQAWEAAPNGLEAIVVHNVAEAGLGTHSVAPDAVIRVEEWLNLSSPPELIYLANVTVSGGDADRLARIVSYGSGGYTVQPVRREAGGYVNDGAPIAAVPNLGELWDEEIGYLVGPAAFDRYVRIFKTPAGWAMLIHPPRLV